MLLSCSFAAEGKKAHVGEYGRTRAGVGGACRGVCDGSGYFGFVGLEPGRYRVVIEEEDFRGRRVIPVQVSAGELSDASFDGKGR